MKSSFENVRTTSAPTILWRSIVYEKSYALKLLSPLSIPDKGNRIEYCRFSPLARPVEHPVLSVNLGMMIYSGSLIFCITVTTSLSLFNNCWFPRLVTSPQ